MILVRQICGVGKLARFQVFPNLTRHVSRDSRTNVAERRLAFLLFEGSSYPIQRLRGGFPMFVGTGGVDPSFQLAESNKMIGMTNY